MSRSIRTAVVVLLGFAGLTVTHSSAAETRQDASAKKLHVAVLTGGHAFDDREFLKLFQGYDDITCKHLPQKAGGEVFEDIADWPYDVIVLYNFNQQLTPKQQENFVKLLDKGVGLVVLHHAVAAYNDWPLYKQIAGVEYHLKPWKQNGTSMAPSGYKHGVQFKIHVADPNHPITRGLAEFELIDETYCRFSLDPGVHVLLTTDEPSSDKTIGWTKGYLNSRICCLQSGHDQTAYQNPTYRTLVVRAIRWTARSTL
jgi:uncharacterized protein